MRKDTILLRKDTILLRKDTIEMKEFAISSSISIFPYLLDVLFYTKYQDNFVFWGD